MTTNVGISRDLEARHPLADGAPPAWADAWGEDRFGGFVEIQIGAARQRMRWIPGGSFTMGSPEDEAGRYDDEDQHEVKVSGLWLADSPCTQALWNEVMSENPSDYQDDERPVENVSHDDALEFLKALAELRLGATLRLPTEAEWERACRANSGEATYVGDVELLGENHAPQLHDIAWYGGNCGVEFDLGDAGYDTSIWVQKQFEFPRGATRRVGEKLPNEFGLYDMLGNVLEWCSDWYEKYDPDNAINPTGPTAGTYRVRRGGSWVSVARYVRAAYRGAALPDNRFDYVGFRLARGPS